jgi:hypothetical protein
MLLIPGAYGFERQFYAILHDAGMIRLLFFLQHFNVQRYGSRPVIPCDRFKISRGAIVPKWPVRSV